MADSLKPIVFEKITFSVAKFVATRIAALKFNLTLNQMLSAAFSDHGGLKKR
jgi:hypothetical protein